MIAFIIKSGLCMVLFFGLYWLLLRKEKLFSFNRYYLIFSILISLTVPFVSIPVVTGYKYEKATELAELMIKIPGQESPEDLAVLPQLENVIPPRAEINAGSEPAVMQSQTNGSRRFLFLIYYSGLILMLLRFLRNILIINRMFRRSEKIDKDWYRIALLEIPVNPFSFLRTVFLNKQEYMQNRISQNVMMHEVEHIRQAHSRDIIFFEILHLIFWFNPVLLLFKRAARINHEYLADEAVIRNLPDMRTYSGELINFISCRRKVTFASGFSPSMIRLRLLMLNSNTTRRAKTIRMVATLLTSVMLMSFLSIRPEHPESENSDNRKRQNKDIVIEEVQFRGPDFNPLKSLIIFNGRELAADEMITIDPQQIKTIDILTNRKAVRKYGKSAKDGAVEISTYDYRKKSVPDSLNFKSVYTVNDRLPEGTITIPVSNLRSLKIWNYPKLPNQTMKQHWRTIELMTRDFYRIRGKVVQKSGEPVPGALVKASGNPAEVRTDADGRFYLEDVNLGAMAELSAEGFEPLNFKATDIVFRSELSMTLDSKNEPDPDMILADAGSEMKDLSGIWKLNKELSRSIWSDDIVHDIHQYDSDSIMFHTMMTFIDGIKRERKVSYVFNTARKTLYPDQNYKSVFMCKIAADGQSFSIIYRNRNIVETMRRYQRSQRLTTYSINEEGKQLIMREYSSPEDSSDNWEEIQLLVFDRM